MKDRLIHAPQETERHAHRHRHWRGQSPSRRRRAAMRTVAVLPSLFTLGNLLAGFLAVFFASRDPQTTMALRWSPLTFAGLCIFLGMLFDALDGRVARLTRATSGLGEQLDSMADMVTFGVAPAFLVVQLIGLQAPFLSLKTEFYAEYAERIALVIAGIYVACAALRLARFNIEMQSSEASSHMSFSGLPSPGAAGALASLVLLHEHLGIAKDPDSHDPNSWQMRATAVFMVIVMLLVAIAMVSRLRYPHALNRLVPHRATFHKLVLVVVIGLLLSIHFQASLAAIFTTYALSAPTLWMYQRVRGDHRRAQASTDVSSSGPANGNGNRR